MRRLSSRLFFPVALAVVLASAVTLPAQRGGMSPEQAERRWAVERELQQVAVVERKVMVPMRDGKRMAADVYYPRNASGPVPTVFSRTPYNFNYWDVSNGVPRDHSTIDRKSVV